MEAKSKIDQTAENRVLLPDFKPSENFFKSDRILAGFLDRALSNDAAAYMEDKLNLLGSRAATKMDEMSLIADKKGPELIKRDKYGQTIDEIRFHPAYQQLMEIAVESEMMRVKWEPSLRKRFAGMRHKLGFAAGYLFSMSESGQYCPLCMTDGVALLLDRFADEGDRDRLLPHIYSENPADFYTGAMFLTEKAGGSDVGANLVRAEQESGTKYRLYGEKWFCSNVNADIIFALARTDAEKKGTRGLSIFLVEKQLEDGRRNSLNIIRLKDKLGTRSMASAECLLEGTEGKLIGEEFEGFRIMAQMINLSRVYNSVAALAGGRRALIEAYQYLSHRKTFGKIALEHALVRDKLWELGSLNLMSFHLVWRAVDALDRSEMGHAGEINLLRLLTPMVKRESAELAVYLARESMELMGGMGYIEDTVMPKIMRDVMVLPIWEGAGNIMLLDMLRALRSSTGMSSMEGEIRNAAEMDPEFGPMMADWIAKAPKRLLAIVELEKDEMEYRAKPFFLELTRMYGMSVMILARNKENESRINLSLRYLSQEKTEDKGPLPSVDEIRDLMGWEF
jgi:alkylation response protein AidB-like acyl-CoA dehydrogenase